MVSRGGRLVQTAYEKENAGTNRLSQYERECLIRRRLAQTS